MVDTPFSDFQTTCYGLPFLYPGQVQKELFYNQALAIVDSAMQPTVESSLAVPPTAPIEGLTFRVVATASGEWQGREDCIAMWLAGAWTYWAPRPGMRVWDRSRSQSLLFNLGWIEVAEPALPAGGDVIDVQARSAIESLIQALRKTGLFADL